MRVVILGCGPAGLLSAYACEQLGHKVVIISKKAKSQIPGAVFLHESIPGLTATEPDGMVEFHKYGTQQGYARKVYGSVTAKCSWSLFDEGDHPAWSMFSLYDRLWERFESSIISGVVAPDDMSFFANEFDLAISTIPAMSICENPDHTFESQGIYVINKSAYPNLYNDIVYNGSNVDSWYRTSNIFGEESTESTIPYSYEFAHSLGGIIFKGYKPTQTDCNCHPKIHRVGRFGRWEKGILVHHAYNQTVRLLENL